MEAFGNFFDALETLGLTLLWDSTVGIVKH